MSTSGAAYGWIAAVCSMLAFGSCGVPIKSEAALKANIDPLVFQTYRVATCFLTSWVVLGFGQEFTFTPWGIVSGLFWVPAGSAAIYSVKAAGLAVGMGIGSSFIVLVAFVWGILVFSEPVSSRPLAFSAIALMVAGIVGMSYYSSPQASSDQEEPDEKTHLAPRHEKVYVEVNKPLDETNGSETEESSSESDLSEGVATDVENCLEEDNNAIDTESTTLFGRRISRRTLGICAAIFKGCWGGSIMAPMHWAPDTAKGAAYVISFGIGASIVIMGAWCLRYSCLLARLGSPVKAYQALPAFHFRTMWQPGGTAGLLWSLGNFCSILSVRFLGVGVGYSVIQASMIVSGLWGIFFFKEVVGAPSIARWMGSAFTTLGGILLLSYTHESLK